MTPTGLTRLRTALENGTIDLSLLADLESEYTELAHKADALETLLITIVRTGWPWDDEGEPNAIHQSARDGFVTAMAEARNLLGLNLASRITRTEPKT